MITKLNSILDNDKEFSELVDLLNNEIENNGKNINLFSKMLIVLMSTKLEVYLENATSNWFYCLKADQSNTSLNLGDEIKKEIIIETYEAIKDDLKRGYIQPRNKSKLNNFCILTEESFPLQEIDIDFKITYGSHGSNEIERLLKKIGIINIFDEMDKQNSNSEELFSIDITSKIDYKGIINKLMKYRNNILHENIYSGLSYIDINSFVDCLNLMACVVDDYINNYSISECEIKN